MGDRGSLLGGMLSSPISRSCSRKTAKSSSQWVCSAMYWRAFTSPRHHKGKLRHVARVPLRRRVSAIREPTGVS